MLTQKYCDDLSYLIIGCAIEVHKELGPGLLESVYKRCFKDLVVVKLKSVEELHPLYDAQLLTYMKLLKKPKGILINFNCTNIFKYGQKTMVNELYAQLPKI